MSKWLSIQALRGVAALSVVAFHCLSIEQKYSGGDFLLPDFFELGQSGVDLFFVISGFVMITVTTGRFGRSGEAMRFLWGRVTRIYPTYWFYFLLTGAIFLIKPNWVNSSQGHQVQFLASFLLLPGNQLPLVMVAWSLIHELSFYLVFAVLLRFNERFLIPALLLWGAIVIMVSLLFSAADLPAGVRIALHPYSLEFIMGAFVAIYISKKDTTQLSARNAILIIVLVLSAGLPAIYVFDVLAQENIMRATLISALFGLIVLSFATLEKLDKFTPPKFLQFIGDISYTVYLSHVLVLSAIGRIWSMATPTPNNLADNFLACFVMLAAVVGYGWVGYRLVEQPALRIAHRLRTSWFENGRLI